MFISDNGHQVSGSIVSVKYETVTGNPIVLVRLDEVPDSALPGQEYAFCQEVNGMQEILDLFTLHELSAICACAPKSKSGNLIVNW